MSDVVSRIFDSWSRGRNVLLYGPPGTGKTRILSELFRRLQGSNQNSDSLEIGEGSSMAMPLFRSQQQLPIPTPAKVVWTTFHQSYTYEDFVLGLKPAYQDGGMYLEPWAGVLFDAALELKDSGSSYNSVVLFIDEINRGNAARIFGEFMTFLDFDYREGGTFPLPVPLRQLSFINGVSEDINRPDGGTASIPRMFYFPRDIYIVATMNSVDRAAVPIDSALARRFDRIRVHPSEEVLTEYWGITPSTNRTNCQELSAYQCAIRIFHRLNDGIASYLGPEFELGHGLFMGIEGGHEDDQTSWEQLARVWDEMIFPQIEDRFSGRNDLLLDLLKATDPPTSGNYAWQVRNSVVTTGEASALIPVNMFDLDLDTIIRSFRWLAK